jgi:cytochrome P450
MAAAAQQAPNSPFLDPSFMDDSYPALAKLRAEDPVHFVAPLGFWLILRHDDVKRLYNDPEDATPDRRFWQHFQPRPAGSFMRWVEDNGFFSMPPFGNGPHFCLGANLARQEMGCMVEAMLDFLPPGSRWLKDRMEFQTTGLFRRPVTLPIEIGPR